MISNLLNSYAQSYVDDVFTFIIGFCAFIVLISAWRLFIDNNTRNSRLRMIAQRRDELRSMFVNNQKKSTQKTASFLTLVLRRFKLARSAHADNIRIQLLRSGIRSRDAVSIYIVIKLISPFLGIGLSLLTSSLYFSNYNNTYYLALVLFISAIAGFFAPDLYLHNKASKRKIALQQAFPDGLDLLVICAEAGLSLDASLHRVAEEIGPSAPVLADELSLTAVEINFLPERRQALFNLENRTNIPLIKGVVSTLLQTEKYGTPLSQSLRVLSSEFRDARILRAEEKAARLPAILTVPMIVFILPTLFIVLMGPAIIDVYDNLIK